MQVPLQYCKKLNKINVRIFVTPFVENDKGNTVYFGCKNNERRPIRLHSNLKSDRHSFASTKIFFPHFRSTDMENICERLTSTYRRFWPFPLTVGVCGVVYNLCLTVSVHLPAASRAKLTSLEKAAETYTHIHGD